jgi:hypothetical protein
VGSDEDVLFSPGRVPHTSPRYRSRLRPLGDADFGRIVKKAARNAGMKEWRAVCPHALRKSFEEWEKRRSRTAR